MSPVCRSETDRVQTCWKLRVFRSSVVWLVLFFSPHHLYFIPASEETCFFCLFVVFLLHKVLKCKFESWGWSELYCFCWNTVWKIQQINLVEPLFLCVCVPKVKTSDNTFVFRWALFPLSSVAPYWRRQRLPFVLLQGEGGEFFFRVGRIKNKDASRLWNRKCKCRRLEVSMCVCARARVRRRGCKHLKFQEGSGEKHGGTSQSDRNVFCVCVFKDRRIKTWWLSSGRPELRPVRTITRKKKQ